MRKLEPQHIQSLITDTCPPLFHTVVKIHPEADGLPDARSYQDMQIHAGLLHAVCVKVREVQEDKVEFAVKQDNEVKVESVVKQVTEVQVESTIQQGKEVMVESMIKQAKDVTVECVVKQGMIESMVKKETEVKCDPVVKQQKKVQVESMVTQQEAFKSGPTVEQRKYINNRPVVKPEDPFVTISRRGIVTQDDVVNQVVDSMEPRGVKRHADEMI